MKKRINLIIKPTNACNLRCKHCYHAEKGYDTEILSISMIEKTVELLSVEYSEISILWHGGEPLLAGKNYFKDCLKRLKAIAINNGCRILYRMQTNATLIDDEWISIIKEYDIKVGISFDGPFNDELRQCTDKVLDAMTLLQNNGIKFGVLCVVTSKNISKLDEIIEWFNIKKLNFKFNPIFESGAAKYNQEFIITPEDYAHYFCKFFQKWLYDTNCQISVTTFENYVLNTRSCSNTSCMYKWLSLDSCGNFYPCGRAYPSRFSLGNIKSILDIKELFESTAYKCLVNMSIMRRKKCIELCQFAGFCQGGCNASAIIENSLDDIGFWECRTEKEILEFITPIIKEFYSDMKLSNYSKYNPIVVRNYNRLQKKYN